LLAVVAGLTDGLFKNQKSNIAKIFQGLCKMGKCR
jgi:hypothetical protein